MSYNVGVSGTRSIVASGWYGIYGPPSMNILDVFKSFKMVPFKWRFVILITGKCSSVLGRDYLLLYPNPPNTLCDSQTGTFCLRLDPLTNRQFEENGRWSLPP